MKHIEISEDEIDKLPRFPIGYGVGFRVMVPYPEHPREGKCDSCGRTKKSGEIRVTALHHWLYAFKRKTIRKNPLLVLKNTSEFCFTCHKYADALRVLFGKNVGAKDWYMVKTALLMPEIMKERLDKFCKSYIIARGPELKRKKT